MILCIQRENTMSSKSPNHLQWMRRLSLVNFCLVIPPSPRYSITPLPFERRSQGHRTGSKSKQGQNVDSLTFSFSKWFPRYGTSMRNTEDFVVHARIWQKTVSAWARASACSDPEKKHNREELKFSKMPIWTIPTV